MADRGRPLPAALVAQMQALHATGLFSLRLLSRRFHVSRNTLRRYVRVAVPLPARKAA